MKKQKKPVPPAEAEPVIKKQPLLKRLLFGPERPDLSELEAGSTTILDILSPTAIDTKSRDYIVVDGVFVMKTIPQKGATKPPPYGRPLAL